MQENFVSVVVPVFNSENTLERLFLRTKVLFESLGKSFEMVLVEDRGTDQSWQEILKLKRNFPEQVKGIRLARNSGQHAATFCGLVHAKGGLVLTLDDDLQTPPEEIKKLLKCYEATGADLVYGIAGQRKHRSWRNLGSRFLKKLAGLAFGGVAEGSSFRLLKGSLVHKMLRHSGSKIFIDGLVRLHTSDIALQEVTHEKRQHGRSGYTFFRLAILAFTLLFHYGLLRGRNPLRQNNQLPYTVAEVV